MKGTSASVQATVIPAQGLDETIEKQRSPRTSRWQQLSPQRKLTFIVLPAVMLVGLALGFGLGLGFRQASASPIASPEASPARSSIAAAKAIVRPTVGMKWDYPLGYDVTASNIDPSVKFISVDLEYTDPSVISDLKAAGHYVACYFSAGSVEKGRDDEGSFPTAAIGKVMDGWPDEKWVDVRSSGLRKVMSTRIKRAASAGCNGVDPDNIDGYGNDTGFDLTQQDAVDYITFMATEARNAGLAIGLKNGGDIATKVVSVTDWEINEQCAQFNKTTNGPTECVDLGVFITNKKPVFHVEYTQEDDDTKPSAAFIAKACAKKDQASFSSIIKHQPLDKWTLFCDQVSKS